MEKLKDIKGIFLDLGGTLIYPPSGDWRFSKLAYQYFPKEKLETPAAAAILREAQIELEKDHLIGGMEQEYEKFYRYYKTLAEALPELGLAKADLEKVTEDKVYNKPDNYRLFDGVSATLEALRGKYKLGILSDTWPSIVPALEYMDILKYFDCVTYSYELNAFKPDPKMYQDALGKMGLPPEQTLFVDDLPKNVEGARAHGINPVLILTQPGARPREDMHCIESISGLLDILA